MANIGGSISPNYLGGHDLTVQGVAKCGNDNLGAAASAFVSGNDKHGPLTTGVSGEINSHGHGLGIRHTNVHGVSSTVSENLRLNAFKNDNNAVNLNAFHNQTQLQNGLKFDSVGANAMWQHTQGHSASVGVTQIPKFDITTMNANATANLWTSPDKINSLNLTGTASQHIAGPFTGASNFGASLGFTHRF